MPERRIRELVGPPRSTPAVGSLVQNHSPQKGEKRVEQIECVLRQTA